MKKTVIINVAGLSQRILGKYTPFINHYIDKGKHALIKPVFPALNGVGQASYITGKWPVSHGIVGEGWYDRTYGEFKFGKQADALVTAEKIWESLSKEDETFTCANLFWQHNLFADVDYGVTYAFGTSSKELYVNSPGLAETLQRELGEFPGKLEHHPARSLEVSKWITSASMLTETLYNPDLTFVYIPYLKRILEFFGNDQDHIAVPLQQLDGLLSEVVTFYEGRGANVLILSEYGVTEVTRVVHINRILREYGFLKVRREGKKEYIDTGRSDAFAVADHQVAHIYVKDKSQLNELRWLLEKEEGVNQVLFGNSIFKANMRHDRSGDLIIIAERNTWFSYEYWMHKAQAPNYKNRAYRQQTPGYHPEMFRQPLSLQTIISWVKDTLENLQTKKQPLKLHEASPVKGSFGRFPAEEQDFPMIIGNKEGLIPDQTVLSTEIRQIIKDHMNVRIYEESFF